MSFDQVWWRLHSAFRRVFFTVIVLAVACLVMIVTGSWVPMFVGISVVLITRFLGLIMLPYPHWEELYKKIIDDLTCAGELHTTEFGTQTPVFRDYFDSDVRLEFERCFELMEMLDIPRSILLLPGYRDDTVVDRNYCHALYFYIQFEADARSGPRPLGQRSPPDHLEPVVRKLKELLAA